jgi:hypothetical protein
MNLEEAVILANRVKNDWEGRQFSALNESMSAQNIKRN